jgi:uncharacterized membrane protein YdbT with pleckstrin-like domain
MDIEIRPDRKYYVKNIWTILTIILFIVIIIFITNMIITLANGDQFAKKIIWWSGLGLIGLLILIVYPISHLWIKNLSYTLLDDRITVHKGIITKIKQNIPFRAVTDFILYRSLYDRILGIGSIKVQTAGQSQTATTYEGNIDGILNFDELHGQLRERIKIFHPTTHEAKEMKSEKSDVLDEILEEIKQIGRKLDK